jgi:hypothetical protein
VPSRKLSLALLLVLFGLPARAAESVQDGWAFARERIDQLKRMGPAERKGRRFLFVVDIDYTVTDPRRRTQAAARRFGLGRVPLAKVGYDGLETARYLGLDARTAQRFQRFWLDYFWSPRHLRLDTALPTIKLLKEAKAAGAEIVYLTGRTDALKDATRDRLRALGMPDPDQVVTKPRVSVRTTTFKRSWLASVPRDAEVILFMTDSARELRAVRRAGLRIPVVHVASPAPEARGSPAGRVPTIRVPRFRRR